MKKQSLKKLLNHLNTLRTQFNRDAADEKLITLKLISVLPIEQKKDLLFYHDHLLFMLAYPDNKNIKTIVTSELNRIAKINEKANKKNQHQFYNQYHATGIANSSVTWRPSVDACNWMVSNFANELEIVWSDDSISKLDELLPIIVAPAQWDSLQADDYDTLIFLKEVSHARNNNDATVLKWICSCFLNLNVPETVRDHLFDSIELTVDWKISDFRASRTGNFITKKDIVYQKLPIVKKFDVSEQLKKPLVKFKEIKNKEFDEVSFSSKSVLAALSRETDTVTYANRIYKASVENGMDVMLFEMRAGRKMPIENYLGFVVYKNGVPVGYGGCWIFLDRCEIGVNIFESFRGGENSLILVNLMRVYHQLFNVKRFVVPPYQFGEDNPEGIQSGAFWFYYRLGYRPIDKKLRAKADQEFSKITKNSNYRSSYKTLESFTASPMELILDGYQSTIDLKKLSTDVNKWIKINFKGDTEAASENNMKRIINELNFTDFNRLSQELKRRIQDYCLIFYKSSFSNLPSEKKSQLKSIMVSKFKNELSYSRLLQEMQNEIHLW